MIQIRRTAEDDRLEFEVVVREGERGDPSPCHDVARNLQAAGGRSRRPSAASKQPFRFLLDRERKEFILGRFDVTVISRYFPEFERELPQLSPP